MMIYFGWKFDSVNKTKPALTHVFRGSKEDCPLQRLGLIFMLHVCITTVCHHPWSKRLYFSLHLIVFSPDTDEIVFQELHPPSPPPPPGVPLLRLCCICCVSMTSLSIAWWVDLSLAYFLSYLCVYFFEC